MSTYIGGEKVYTDKNLQLGITNLLTGTHDFSGFNNLGTNNGTKDFYGNTQYLLTGAWSGPMKNVPVIAGQTYIFSCVIQAVEAPISIAAEAGDNKNGANATLSVLANALKGNQYSRTAITINDTDQHVLTGLMIVAKSGLLTPRAELTNDGKALVSSYKFEQGKIPTGWAPAPQDLFDMQK